MAFFGLFGKPKVEKIKREDVVRSIGQLENQQGELMAQIENHRAESDKFFTLGKKEKSRELQQVYAERIASKNRDIAMMAKRLSFLDRNLEALNRLRYALEDREFVNNNSKMSLTEMLDNPAELTKFLSSTIDSKVAHETRLENALEIFDTVDGRYEQGELYNITDETAAIMRMFNQEGKEAVEEQVESIPDKIQATEPNKIKQKI